MTPDAPICMRCEQREATGYAMCEACRAYKRRQGTRQEMKKLCTKIGISYDDALASGLWQERLK